MKYKGYDFAGWATRNDVKCSDGRTIRRDAFKDQDGCKVPLLWSHQHNDPENVLGHAFLENRPEGVWTYGYFNDTYRGQHAKSMVQHGDIEGLSIWANNLEQTPTRDVLHGKIRELSLVMAGANPKAGIEEVVMHSDETFDGIIFMGAQEFEMYHAEDDKEPETKEEPKEESKEEPASEKDEKTVKEIFDSMNEEQQNAVYAAIGMVLDEDSETDDEVEHAESEDGKTINDIFDTMTEDQKNVAYFMIGEAIEEAGKNTEEVKHEDIEGGNTEMKHNVFDKETSTPENTLSHDEMTTIIKDAKTYGGSLKESFLAHAEEYGIQNIDWLFPEARTLNNPPEFIKRDMSWVSHVMGRVHKSPFSRIKSVFADITEDEARAKGYIKGNLKKEEVFSLLKRTTTPTTIYKKQKMDRDDQIDITDFDVVAWLKAEMRMMLDEEIARAILIGDGRLASSDDKINEQNIRPVAFDEDLFNIKAKINVARGADSDAKAKAFIRAVIKSRKNYKGSGNPTLYTTEDMVTDCLLLTDEMGRDLYDSVEKLKTKLRVKEIVTVEPMEGLTNKEGKPIVAVLVNLNDYNVGADKGGAINMFDDFDIDYNQMKYLIETRCSGALVKPFSAITYTMEEA